MLLSVVVPARNEAACLGRCLESLCLQSESGFLLGQDWELLVVDDGSTDGTRAIAKKFSLVNVLDPLPLQSGWTGKTNALWTAARQARGKWVLFTDADTEHRPGSLQRAVFEASLYHTDLLSYSPFQVVRGVWRRSVMPLVFSELAMNYPPKAVNDPNSETAVANGQFLLFCRASYFAIGGHETVASEVLEDVALARKIKQQRMTLRFRYAAEEISAEMYRSTSAMVEGWTKNLALLFENPLALALLQLLDLLILVGLPLLTAYYWRFGTARWLLLLLWMHSLLRFYRKRARSNFPVADCWLSLLGLPLFVWLLFRSWYCHSIRKKVVWKGREYEA